MNYYRHIIRMEVLTACTPLSNEPDLNSIYAGLEEGRYSVKLEAEERLQLSLSEVVEDRANHGEDPDFFDEPEQCMDSDEEGDGGY
jgi:hypothetical protein